MPEVIVGRDEDDSKKFGANGTLYIGKHIVGTGEDTHLTTPVLLDVLRPHIITITGKRGEGKCLHGDTLITLSDGSSAAIKELENNMQNVMSLNDELKITAAKKTGFYKRKVNELMKIRLRSGKEIKLTPEHPLFTIKGWKPAHTLQIGGRVATPRKIDNFSDYVIDDHKVKILAYLIAEGHIRSHGGIDLARFVNNDKKIVQDFKESARKFDKNLEVRSWRPIEFAIIDKRKPLTEICTRNAKGQIIASKKKSRGNSIITWLKNIGAYGELSKNKILPGIVFKFNRKQTGLFVNRLFSCDGSIYETDGTYSISYSTSSEKMARQMQHLLLRFGIVSKLRTKKIQLNGREFTSYEIVIRGNFTKIFLEEIGFYGRKEERQKDALNRVVERNTNTDTIPKDIWDAYKPQKWAAIGRAFGYAYPKAMRESARYSPSRQKLLEIAKIKSNEGLRTLAESDIFWDEIVSIELLDGEFEVYDISVPEYHNFIANDIIVHNSYSMGVIMEEMFKLSGDIRKNLCGIVVDTQGIYWTMKSPAEKDAALLNEWGMQPAGFPVEVYVPEGQEKIFASAGVDFDATFSFSPSELSAEDWISVFSLDINEPLSILLQRSLSRLSGSYSIADIISSLRSVDGFDREKDALENRLEAAKSWGIFGSARVPSLLEPGKLSILDVSLTPQNVRALLVGLASKKIFLERVEARRKEELAEIEMASVKRTPMPWIFIDEAHNFLPDTGTTPAMNALNRIVKEGRQPGITLVLATQRPEKLHPDALAQTDMILSHRLTAKSDVDALKAIMQTYLLYNIGKYINELPKLKGVAIILDDNSERLYKVRVRPRQSWHAGSSPVAV